MTEEGAAEHIDKLAKKYMGVDKYPFHRPRRRAHHRPGEPQKVSHGW